MTIWQLLFFFVLGAGALIAIGLAKGLKTTHDNAEFRGDFPKYYGYKNTQIALSTERSAVKLRVGRNMTTYRFADVRGWQKHWHNSKREGTLTIDVRDIERPVWTIKFGSEDEMNRWYELMGQAINEQLKL